MNVKTACLQITEYSKAKGKQTKQKVRVLKDYGLRSAKKEVWFVETEERKVKMNEHGFRKGLKLHWDVRSQSGTVEKSGRPLY